MCTIARMMNAGILFKYAYNHHHVKLITQLLLLGWEFNF